MQHQHALPKTIYTSRLIERVPIFYGWVIAIIGTIALVMTSPGQTYAVAIFIEYLIADLDISRSLVSSLYSGGSLIAGFALPFIGQRIDKQGSRFVMTALAIILGLVCIYMSFVGGAVMLALGFLALRMFGQGGLALVSTTVVNQWWMRRRGTVLGLSGLFTAILGLAGFPILINWLIPIYGWRSTYSILGLMLLLGMAPLAFIFLRDQPEKYGLHPDGVALATQSEEGSQFISDEENWTVSEIIHTATFWFIAVGVGSISMMATGLFFHMVSIFADSGLASTVAATMFVPIAMTTAVVTLGGGILVDRIPVQFMLAIALFLQATSLVIAPFLYSIEIAFVYSVILGATMGFTQTVARVIWAAFYGRLHLGSISGVASTAMVIGAALGPMPFGIGRDLLGSYTQVLLISAALPLFLGITALFIRKPRKHNIVKSKAEAS